jgi:hypothetical protein
MTEPGLAAVLATAAAVSSLLLAGLIWVVHLVVYPAFALVGPAQWADYHRARSQRITVTVGRPWAVQGLSALGLLALRPEPAPLALVLAHAALVALPVAVTAVSSMPAHRRLSTGPDDAARDRLLAGNRLRVAAWTGSAVTGTWLLLAVA